MSDNQTTFSGTAFAQCHMQIEVLRECLGSAKDIELGNRLRTSDPEVMHNVASLLRYLLRVASTLAADCAADDTQTQVVQANLINAGHYASILQKSLHQ